jgi:hypothetical protein
VNSRNAEDAIVAEVVARGTAERIFDGVSDWSVWRQSPSFTPAPSTAMLSLFFDRIHDLAAVVSTQSGRHAKFSAVLGECEPHLARERFRILGINRDRAGQHGFGQRLAGDRRAERMRLTSRANASRG